MPGEEMTPRDDVRWWAGIATVLPRGSLVPPRGPRLLRRLNEYRLDFSRKPIFRYPRITPDQARRLAVPSSTGFGDLVLAWMLPLTLAEMHGWQLRIPVPANAGGLHHDPARPKITPEWLHETLALPPAARMVAAETPPDSCQWFCTLEQQWHLNSCMETSYDTIPWWLRDEVGRSAYYETYQRVARGLRTASVDVFGDGRPYFALHARRADRGQAGDDRDLREIVTALAAHCRDWAVMSDDPQTASTLRVQLQEAGCRVARHEPPDQQGNGDADADPRRHLIFDFETMRGASAVVSSVGGGWSAFPYAATRLSGAPLVFTEPLHRSIVWRVIRGHSRLPIRGIHHGPDDLADFRSGPLPSGSPD